MRVATADKKRRAIIRATDGKLADASMLRLNRHPSPPAIPEGRGIRSDSDYIPHLSGIQ